MILKNNLYKINHTDAEDRKVNLQLIPTCMIYKAHFPEQPITPGVCIIQMATEALSELLGQTLVLSAVTNAKFLSVINPAETKGIYITFKKLNIDQEAGEVKTSAVIADKNTVFSKLSLAYKL